MTSDNTTDNGTTTSDFKTSDEIKPDGKVTRMGGKSIEGWAKSPIKKGK